MNLPRPLKALMCAQLFSLTGEAVMRFALPLYVLNLTGSADAYGTVAALAFVPYILLTPIGGVLADRMPKQRIMAALDVLLALASAAYLALEGTFDLIALTVATLMVLYAAQSIYQPTVQASVPFLVEGEHLTTGVGLVSQISTLTGIVGPVLGGLVFGLLGIGPVVAISAAAYLASCALVVTLVRIPRTPGTQSQSSENPLATARADLACALQFLRANAFLSKTVLAVTLTNLTVSAFIIVGAPFAVTEVLGLSSQLMGFAEAALGAGGLVGGMLVSMRPKQFPLASAPRLLALGAGGLVGAGAALFAPLALAAYALFVLCLAFSMGCFAVFSVVTLAYLQSETPKNLVGKVVALVLCAVNCATPAGQVVYGATLDASPAAAVAFGAAAAGLVIAAVLQRMFVRNGVH